MKTCAKCKASKALAEFSKNSRYRGGFRHQCKVCVSKNTMKWVESNLERRTSYNKKYNKDNAEKLYENKKAKYASNPELQAKYNKKWKENNPENVAATEHRRRARKASNGVNLVTAAEIAAIIAQPCMACDAPAPSTIEHLIPISRGGAHSVGNLAPLCQPCNSSKNDMTWAEWKHSNRAQAKKAFGR